MKSYNFYSSKNYKEKQKINTKSAWERGDFKHLFRIHNRKCSNIKCKESFSVNPSNPKKFCTSSCSAKVSNLNRELSQETKNKISNSLKGKISPLKGIIKVPRVERSCAYDLCQKTFVAERWNNKKFCGNQCAMRVIGSKPTSPKAAKAKSGIRKDINTEIYFYSRWEANIARLLNYLNINWVYQPTTFDLKDQKYTPDFYLPDYNLYVEVKNFLGKYSKNRDDKFRRVFPNLRLKLLLKDEYLILEESYSELISNWEHKNDKS